MEVRGHGDHNATPQEALSLHLKQPCADTKDAKANDAESQAARALAQQQEQSNYEKKGYLSPLILSDGASPDDKALTAAAKNSADMGSIAEAGRGLTQGVGGDTVSAEALTQGTSQPHSDNSGPGGNLAKTLSGAPQAQKPSAEAAAAQASGPQPEREKGSTAAGKAANAALEAASASPQPAPEAAKQALKQAQ